MSLETCQIPKTKVLFCLYSQAEASDLSEIFAKINPRLALIKVLAFGAAKDFLLKTHPELLLSMEGDEGIGDKGCYQEEKINGGSFREILQIAQNYDIFITGFGSDIQVDILKEIKRRNPKAFSIGYYDPFQTFKEHPFAKRLLQLENPISIDALMVTCYSLKEECSLHFPKMDIKVVGKRDLDHWESYPKEKNSDILKKACLSWNPNHLTFLYGGCYGSDYANDFRLFLKSIKNCRKLSDRPIDVWVSPHPAKECNGDFEREEIEKLGIENVVVCKKSVPTVSLLPFADLFLSSTSGTVLSASVFGVPSFHICKKYSNYLIAKKIVQKAAMKKEVAELFKHSRNLIKLPIRNEIPKNATENIANYLNNLISSKKIRVKT